jgi:hypothetical protein
MEEVGISSAAIVEHLFLTLIPWLIGIVVGGGLGALCAFGIRASLSASPALFRPLVLLPWRTLVLGLLMAVWSPYIVALLGIGPLTGGAMVASSASLLATAFTATTLVENWHPSPLGARLIGGARTLAIASGLIAAGVGLLTGGGLGPTILEAARLAQHGLVWKGWMVMLALALVLDLAVGLAQMIAFQQTGDNGEAAIARGLAV